MTQEAAANPYAAKPWLSLYEPGIAPTQTREHHDMLSLFRAALSDRLARAEGWDRSLSPSWYGMAVKLDLEARGEIKRTGSPQRLLRA